MTDQGSIAAKIVGSSRVETWLQTWLVGWRMQG